MGPVRVGLLQSLFGLRCAVGCVCVWMCPVCDCLRVLVSPDHRSHAGNRRDARLATHGRGQSHRATTPRARPSAVRAHRRARATATTAVLLIR
eukprot:2098383-Prymnesium_polylepis.1